MKKPVLLSVILISAAAFNACTSGNADITSNNEIISFYNVPLVCNAAPTIGCGSLSKPALLELEKKSEIKEAWLNRAGTVIAIVWKNSEQTKGVAKPILEKNKITFSEASSKERKSYLETFRKENFWYRGADVDKLSLEEAETITNSYITLALDNKWISQDEAGKIRPDLETYFKTELVKLRTVDELYNDSGNKFRQDVVDIFIKHIGKEKTDNIIELYDQWRKECDKKEGCCKKQTKKSCCKKK